MRAKSIGSATARDGAAGWLSIVISSTFSRSPKGQYIEASRSDCLGLRLDGPQGMLVGLTTLFHRWVLYPVRLLQRGVRRVARGAFDYKIDLKTGDEMQGLAEAFNDMTARLDPPPTSTPFTVKTATIRSERLAERWLPGRGGRHGSPAAPSIAFCAESSKSWITPAAQDGRHGRCRPRSFATG